MMCRLHKRLLRIPVSLAPLAFVPAIYGHEIHVCPGELPDRPVISSHIEHLDIASGTLPLRGVLHAGEALFVAAFNRCDGQGRPATTGTGEKRVADEPAMIRTSAPDSNACAGCHNQPRAGGGGDFVANVFVLAQALDPVTSSIDAAFSNERNTLGMFGSGAIEMLAREMSVDLQAQAGLLPDGKHTLDTKGVTFEVTIAGGMVVDSEGIDTDLIVKPFHQAGVVVSLREFTVNAFNHHHGMQAEERFDLNPAKGFDPDFDEDGIERELTVGDITATVIFQAALPVPGRVLPADPQERASITRGEALFAEIGCADCHIPALLLDDPRFHEPNPFNPPGTCSSPATCPAYTFDLTRDGDKPRLERARQGGALVRAYTDLKRHNLCDPVDMPDAIRVFCNEQLAQGRPPQNGRPGQEFFITRKLWDVGNSAPYGHRGDMTTIAEAILAHGGEARASRDSFINRSPNEQRSIVAFLRTLQVLPEGSPQHLIEP